MSGVTGIFSAIERGDARSAEQSLVARQRVSAVLISLSGVMPPGPMTAAVVAAGTRGRHAGEVIALGRAVVEFPLLLVIITGVGRLLELESVKIGIGLAGGTFLLIVGVHLLLAVGRAQAKSAEPSRKRPLPVGILLTADNPYFLIFSCST